MLPEDLVGRAGSRNAAGASGLCAALGGDGDPTDLLKNLENMLLKAFASIPTLRDQIDQKVFGDGSGSGKVKGG